MATVHGPIIGERSSIEESNGAIKRLVCHYEVKGVTGVTISAKMKTAYDALTSAGIIFGGVVPEFPDLMLTDRNFSLMSGTNDVWVCEVTLMNYADLEGQGVFSSASGMTSYTSYTDYFMQPLTESYDYPADYYDPQLAGQTRTIIAPINVNQATDDLTVTKLVSTANPTVLADSWRLRLNLSRNSGSAARLSRSLSCLRRAISARFLDL